MTEENNKNQKLFATTLRNHLVKNGTSLGDITSATNISLTILNDFVEGHFSKLPQKVFSRNFLIQICKAGSLDNQELLKLFEHAWKEHENKETQSTIATKIPVILAGLLLTISAAITIFFLFEPNSQIELTPDVAPPLAPQQLAPHDAGPLPFAQVVIRTSSQMDGTISSDGVVKTIKLIAGENRFIFSQSFSLDFKSNHGIEAEFNGRIVLPKTQKQTSLKRLVFEADSPWVDTI